jgi:hypothetical protein
MNKEVLQGSTNHFGPRGSEVDSAVDLEANVVRQIALPIYTTAGSLLLNVAPDTDDTVNIIPANSFIKSCQIYVEDAFTSTADATGIDVGLVQADDGTTEIDLDGLIAVGGVGAKANLTAGSWDAGDGALIGTEIGSEAGLLYAKWATGGASDTLTGTGVVLVEYIPPLTHLLADKT